MRKVHDNNNVRIFTEDEIKGITKNYRTLIGKGGFGEVFSGDLDDDDGQVAVKRYIRGDLREEFMEEVRIHAQMRHKNIVKLIGYCMGENTLMMVTEFILNGSLEDVLCNREISIPLNTRLGIAVGCAEALSYMHLSSDSLVYHGDIKPGNILLDANLTPKVSDFGISKSLSGGLTRYTLHIMGCEDYVDPLYVRDGRLTPKSDVYSFGIVLLELIARRRVKQDGVNLIISFGQACVNGKGLRELFDAEITEECNMNVLEEIAKLAIECLTLDIEERPKINDVAQRLRTLQTHREGQESAARKSSSSRMLNALRKGYKQSTSIFISTPTANHRRNAISEIKYEMAKQHNFRSFTKENLFEVMGRYKSPLGDKGSGIGRYNKGTLEDNMLVVVKSHLSDEDVFMIFYEASIVSQIVHEGIIKLLGYCFDADFPMLVYEYADRGSLYDILNSAQDIPLGLRLKIAVKTAEALDHLHSSPFCVRHGDVRSTNILLDKNLMPKISGFTSSRRLTKGNLSFDNVEKYCDLMPKKIIRDDPSYIDPKFLQSDVLTTESDVYGFGIILLELISRKKLLYQDKKHRPVRLIPEFIKAYKTEGSGNAMFDKGITAKKDIAVLENIGRLALRCLSMEIRPTMKDVAEQLGMIRRAWKQHAPQGHGCTGCWHL
uniref:Protein kinase domain-containing protein n=1 Tax=Oryza barthii TaxID=65489 RepID=A0A0D3HN12_9ORYZ